MRKDNIISTIFYPTVEMYQWDSSGRDIKDLVLTNEYASKYGVSEMSLHVTKFSAIAEDGTEHFVSDFQGQRSLRLYGIPSGRNIRSRSIVNLEPGRYIQLKFYLEGGSFVFSDRREMPLTGHKTIEFDIQNALEVKGGESPQFILRFDFLPFQSFGVSKLLGRSVKLFSGTVNKYVQRAFSNA